MILIGHRPPMEGFAGNIHYGLTDAEQNPAAISRVHKVAERFRHWVDGEYTQRDGNPPGSVQVNTDEDGNLYIEYPPGTDAEILMGEIREIRDALEP